MSIISEVQELDSIEKEIKRLSSTLRDLRKRKRYLTSHHVQSNRSVLF